ncbi:HAD hydrolase-like protein [Rhizobium sp. BK491]|uniref:HAD hydrolase-like protein n=1 Tax=Rhizobium sp. BK491 TaxID=2587009 RepID=UPI001FEF31B6|nr:HAD hydrolase-like protein [Rhizobium sp. BK491]
MLAISRWTNAEAGRIVCIGDSIEHDIKGADDMDLASVLVRTGILAAASQQELAELTRRHHAVPSYLMPCFSVDAA